MAIKQRKFHAWVECYGVAKLARELDVQPRTVYWWLNGRDDKPINPRIEHAKKIVELSKGSLTLDDILISHEAKNG